MDHPSPRYGHPPLNDHADSHALCQRFDREFAASRVASVLLPSTHSASPRSRSHQQAQTAEQLLRQRRREDLAKQRRTEWEGLPGRTGSPGAAESLTTGGSGPRERAYLDGTSWRALARRAEALADEAQWLPPRPGTGSQIPRVAWVPGVGAGAAVLAEQVCRYAAPEPEPAGLAAARPSEVPSEVLRELAHLEMSGQLSHSGLIIKRGTAAAIGGWVDEDEEKTGKQQRWGGISSSSAGGHDAADRWRLDSGHIQLIMKVTSADRETARALLCKHGGVQQALRTWRIQGSTAMDRQVQEKPVS
jgi:hypothetical protein